MVTRVLRGVCAVCRVDLYRDPLYHYTSHSHLDRAASWERAQAKRRAGQRVTRAERDRLDEPGVEDDEA